MDSEYYKFLKEIDCKQGAVRSVRFSGKEIAVEVINNVLRLLIMCQYMSLTYIDT